MGEQRCPGSILITSQGYYPWAVENISGLTLESLKQITDQRQEIDILLLGLGEQMVFLPKAIQVALESQGIAVEVMATGAAARTYNVLLLEGRKVAAALIAVA